ncbi:Spermidine/putrescine import ATP-binding protein PotA [Roseovarius litorisediminis]|uniref:Spermidine/putrescine import ATP-binding protein PotA n=1 Tax=Roseovarius litorisediminis TaxID=1312363 RepID=A0A1Y5R5N7_9RHOB|nr:ABC transporter ATP-binding protein [Roseovarius litorisediminis]SLN09566.1 Spermidine/putrescine import ATP-binding protein PotA [Roseovarius litorisediminis]
MSGIIELRNISKHFGSVIGIDHVDLSVEDGEFLTLLGPSGCGKSTLLRMIGGFEEPTTGSIFLSGQDVTDLPPQKRDVNMMFQDYALFPHMTVGQNIAYGLKMKGVGKADALQKAKAALELVGLPDKIDQMPHQMSGGQRQRIALARAIVREPKVLLLDEPLSALDANLREQMQVELKHIHDKLGITFIMVTHDQREALVMSDRVIVMERGRIAQDGSPQDLYEHPKTTYVANFIGTTNFMPARITARNGIETHLEIAGQSLLARYDRVPDTENIQIGIRPEKAHILDAESTTKSNVLVGRVAEHIYHGSSLRTTIKLTDGIEFHIDAMLPLGMARADVSGIGAEVRIGIEPENVFLFEREG